MGYLHILIFLVIYRQKTTFYRIAEEGAQRETSFFGHVFKKSLPLGGISGIEVRRGIIHRLLGIGHLQFRSQDSGRPDLWWFGVKDPFMVKKRAEQVLGRSRV